MGLGSVDSGVGLAEARAERDKFRHILRSGRNPIEVRQQERRASAKKPTFGEIAEEFLKGKAREWSNAKHCPASMPHCRSVRPALPLREAGLRHISHRRLRLGLILGQFLRAIRMPSILSSLAERLLIQISRIPILELRSRSDHPAPPHSRRRSRRHRPLPLLTRLWRRCLSGRYPAAGGGSRRTGPES
jgi:hypothetical protein